MAFGAFPQYILAQLGSITQSWHSSPMNKRLRNLANVLGIVAVLSAAATIAMVNSIPYRISQGLYARYLWTERLAGYMGLFALLAMVSAFALGISSRRRLPLVLAIITCALMFFFFIQGESHSFPDPQRWCYNNLRRIEFAKSQYASDNQLTNGTPVTEAQISKYLDGGFGKLVCAEHGKYIIGAIGTEARCSVHGSINASVAHVPPPYSTNVPGIYHLDHPWVGESKMVVQTGDFTGITNEPATEKIERELRFDLYTVRDPSAADPPGLIIAHRPGLLVFSQSEGRTTNGWSQSKLHVYRPALPSDDAIKACLTVTNLTELLGAPHDADGGPYEAFWSFFTFTTTNTIETLKVSCIASQWKGPLKGLEIRRGVAEQNN